MSLNPANWNWDLWVALGFLGQLCFGGRMMLQWIWSERRKMSVIPIYYWYLSIAGASIIAVYAIHRRDPVFVVGQFFGLFIYVRNVMLMRRTVVAPTVVG
jgi:lipid-A-disaccharide synthase-like uncharacterized protein